jgi:hypothetical protein
MIKIDGNKPGTVTITNDQLNAVVDIITEAGWDLDYDIVEGDSNGIVWLWEHRHPGSGDPGNPTRHWIETDGQIRLSEEVTWDWKGTDHDN